MLARRWFRWTLILAFWTLLAVFFASQNAMTAAYRQRPITWRQALVFPAINYGLWALLTPLVLWGARKFPFEKGRWGRAVVFHIFAGLVTVLVQLRLFSIILPHLYFPPPPTLVPSIEVFRNLTLNNLHFSLLLYAALVGASHGFAYYGRFRERELRASQLAARLAQAQLQVLRMQLHPHFLFNTLHTISALLHEDVEAADRMLARLADLLRMTLAAGSEQEVALRQELEFLDRYLEIEQTRFGERLRIHREIAPGTLDARVPYLILQPIVENAIRHGIAPRVEGGSVEIRASRRDSALRLEVRDDGPGISSVVTAANSGGLGLANTGERLAQLYGGAGKFELANSPAGGLVVTLTIPWRLESEKNNAKGSEETP